MDMYELIPYKCMEDSGLPISFSCRLAPWLVLPVSVVCASLYPVSCVSKQIPSQARRRPQGPHAQKRRVDLDLGAVGEARREDQGVGAGW